MAAFSVALVALPMSMGIAMASGVQAMSGLISGIVGGIVTTFFRGGHVAINGPAAGLIAVVLGAIISMEDGSGRAINYMLAAVVVSGGLQVLFGLLGFGKLAHAIPGSVIHGMLAAIGIIILSNQIHVALGTDTDATSTLAILRDAIYNLPELNPFIAIISVVSILLLAFQASIKHPLFQVIPAPIWVLFIAVSFVYIFNFFESHNAEIMGKSYPLGPSFLIQIPNKFFDAFLFPDFSKINTPAFWVAVLSLSLIASLETLAIAKAIDKLDPYQRITDMNKDLIGNGLATMVCGGIGGLPIIPVIARSSVNIQNHAKTRWSNFYYGIFLLLFVLVFTPAIQKVPRAALAAILVYTGYQLAAPRVFRSVLKQGAEQFIFLFTTLLITLLTDLLWGILGGFFVVLIAHLFLSRLSITEFYQQTFRMEPRLEKKGQKEYQLTILGIANFLSLLRIERYLTKIPFGMEVVIDLSETRLVDITVQERLNEYLRRYNQQGGVARIKGLEKHWASSNNPLSLKVKG